MSDLRVGSVPFLVGRPLDAGLAEEPGIALELAPPAVLVERLRAGRLDVALVSSIELFRRPGYGYLSGVAVAGRGFVGSVQVFLRRPLDEVRQLALDPASRTAATLVRVLLADRPGGPPEFVELPLDADPAAAGTDAWLRIGDEALRETLRGRHAAFNPSEAWAERTGLPFVFAAWVVRPGVDPGPHLGAFARARRRGRARVAELSRSAAERWALPVEACHRYLAEECAYELDGGMARSLEAFRDAASALGLCRAELEPAPIPLPVEDHAAPDR